MTYQVMKSRMTGVEGDFDARVAAHRKEIKAWSDHMELVKDGKAQLYPEPMEHPEVHAAACAPSYEVVDDSPGPDVVLRMKKNRLIGEVSRLEMEALNAIVPLGKRRLLHMRENDILAADNERRTKIASENPDITPAKLAAAVAKGRASDDTNLLADQAEWRKQSDKIARAAAQMHHDIEDLSAETVDAWRPTPFK